jgi:hypothetical protein
VLPRSIILPACWEAVTEAALCGRAIDEYERGECEGVGALADANEGGAAMKPIKWIDIALLAIAGISLSCRSDCQSAAETLCEASMKENYEEVTQKLGEEWAEDSLKKCVAEQVLRCES